MNSYQTEKSETPKAWVAMFDHEKLDAYQMELHFIAWVTPLLDEVLASAKGKTREVCDQLDRASLSALLNTAEGNGKRQRPVRAKFFDARVVRPRNVLPAWMRWLPNSRRLKNEFLMERRCWYELFRCYADWWIGLTIATGSCTRNPWNIGLGMKTSLIRGRERGRG